MEGTILMPGFSFYRGVFGGHKTGGVRVFVGGGNIEQHAGSRVER